MTIESISANTAATSDTGVQPKRVQVFSGQDQLVPALEALVPETLSDPDALPDITLINDFVTDPELLALIGDEGADSWVVKRKLYKATPSLREADKWVAERWRSIGYTGLEVTDGIMLDMVRRQGISPHLDDIKYKDGVDAKVLEAVAQGSLCLTGERTFMAERLDKRFVREDGTFDLEAYEHYNRFGGELAQTLDPRRPEGPRMPRTSAVVKAGGLALFAHHPSIVLHGVRRTEGQASIARLLSWCAHKPKLAAAS